MHLNRDQACLSYKHPNIRALKDTRVSFESSIVIRLNEISMSQEIPGSIADGKWYNHVFFICFEEPSKLYRNTISIIKDIFKNYSKIQTLSFKNPVESLVMNT